MKNKHLKNWLLISSLLVLLGIGFFIFTQSKPEDSIVSAYKPFPSELSWETSMPIDEASVVFAETRIEGYKADLEKESLSVSDRLATWVALAQNYLLIGDYRSMIDAIEEAVAIGGDSQAVLKTYSEMLYRVGDYQKALDVAEQAIALRPDNELPWLWRAELEANLLVEPLGASRVYEKALDATGNNYDVLIAYASFLGWNGAISESVAQWENLKEKYPNMSSLADERIEMLMSQ